MLPDWLCQRQNHIVMEWLLFSQLHWDKMVAEVTTTGPIQYMLIIYFLNLKDDKINTFFKLLLPAAKVTPIKMILGFDNSTIVFFFSHNYCSTCNKNS
jgi:hypothetical protein